MAQEFGKGLDRRLVSHPARVSAGGPGAAESTPTPASPLSTSGALLLCLSVSLPLASRASPCVACPHGVGVPTAGQPRVVVLLTKGFSFRGRVFPHAKQTRPTESALKARPRGLARQRGRRALSSIAEPTKVQGPGHGPTSQRGEPRGKGVAFHVLPSSFHTSLPQKTILPSPWPPALEAPWRLSWAHAARF